MKSLIKEVYPLLKDFIDVESEQTDNISEIASGRVLSNVLFAIAGFGIIITCVIFEIPYSVLRGYLKTYIN